MWDLMTPRGGSPTDIVNKLKVLLSRWTPTWEELRMLLYCLRILPNYANTDCWKDYEPGTILGKGTFGTTYLATKKGTNEKYAVKVNDPKAQDAGDIALIRDHSDV